MHIMKAATANELSFERKRSNDAKDCQEIVETFYKAINEGIEEGKISGSVKANSINVNNPDFYQILDGFANQGYDIVLEYDQNKNLERIFLNWPKKSRDYIGRIKKDYSAYRKKVMPVLRELAFIVVCIILYVLSVS